MKYINWKNYTKIMPLFLIGLTIVVFVKVIIYIR